MYLVIEAEWSWLWVCILYNFCIDTFLFHRNIFYYYIHDIFLIIHVFNHEYQGILYEQLHLSVNIHWITFTHYIQLLYPKNS